MSDIRKAYTQYLETKAAVTALVTATRIRPQFLPQNDTEPVIVVRIISGESDQHLTGGCGSAQTRMQIDCFADDPTEAYAVREAVRVSTPPSCGAQWGVGDDLVTVTDLAHENFGERDEYPIDGSSRPRCVAHFDLVVQHHEAVPA